MSWVKQALEQLKNNGTCTIYPIGNSTRGKIESGQEVSLTNKILDELTVGDIVFIRWKGNYLLHLILEIKEDQVLIGNNLGKVNGWIDRKDVLAKAIQLEQKQQPKDV
ncbi:hypothetical protein QNI16_31000 [Cytophagaceae bacterium YF14B1]|uniref:Peptidase S24/S26A/S26B/S26C domain-containing protein n=1 Tax=Xanthocytophaga flava TaxID=3048013 RepID=A0AAE3UCM5_9BACT|nr:hypothetical protein [Xanthocytophaga flavus]MDJ1484969.1 hypothetical protein [Xanthocytophaga flavus]